MAFWEISPLALTLYTKIVSYVWPNGKFLIFLFQFGSLVIKAMAFWEISPLALLCTQKWCLMYGQTQNFYYFPIGLVCWLSQPGHLAKFC